MIYDTSNIIISNKHKTGVAGIHVDKNTGKSIISSPIGSSVKGFEVDFNILNDGKI